ncbi:YuiB family protein [Bacillus alkalicellulosilyticus]|uniref:YuiB family protein n=1 Tax=Alkalihalobacterium alkalicellulosilyticum TaxID=1912214 RepID=UPI00099622B6|nr:YuiB family protein [Bacillus alkalicellulosilyticus]
MSLPQLIISIMLFLILFFGIGFLLNMILRGTWVMAIIYPLVVIFIIDDVRLFEYFISPIVSFQSLGQNFIGLHLVDIIILTSGLIGAILSGIVIKLLRKQGYQMF